jgi:hypothetical protein
VKIPYPKRRKNNINGIIANNHPTLDDTVLHRRLRIHVENAM